MFSLLSQLEQKFYQLRHNFNLIFIVLIAFIMFSHGSQKLFGWFGGNGIEKTALLFESLGLAPGEPLVILARTLKLIFAAGLLFPKTRVFSGLGIIVFILFAGLRTYGSNWFLFGGYGWEFAFLLIISLLVSISSTTKKVSS